MIDDAQRILDFCARHFSWRRHAATLRGFDPGDGGHALVPRLGVACVIPREPQEPHLVHHDVRSRASQAHQAGFRGRARDPHHIPCGANDEVGAGVPTGWRVPLPIRNHRLTPAPSRPRWVA